MKKIISLLLSVSIVFGSLAGLSTVASAQTDSSSAIENSKSTLETITEEFISVQPVMYSGYEGTLTTSGYKVASVNDDIPFSYFEFTPSKSGVYSFFTTGMYDTAAYLFSGTLDSDDAEFVALSDDTDEDNYNFHITAYLHQGETYTLLCGLSGASSVTSASFRVYAKDENTQSLIKYSYNDSDKTAAVSLYAGNDDEVIIPQTTNGYTVTSISGFAFLAATLKSVSIPSTVQAIGAYAFSDCYDLEKVSFGENSALQYIDVGAFSFCYNLGSEIEIPRSVKTIEAGAFYETAITKAVILSRNCYIGGSDEDDFAFPTEAVIYGYNNSTAQDCAAMAGSKFVSLGDYPFGNYTVYSVNDKGFSVSCDVIPGATGYDIEVNDGSGWVIAASIHAKSGVVTGLKKCTDYEVRMRAFTDRNTAKKHISAYSDVKSVTTTPSKVTGLATVARGSNGSTLTISWNTLEEATSYNIYAYNKPADSWTFIANTTANKYIDETVTPGYEYNYRVAAVKDSIEGVPSDTLHTCAACETMKAPSVNAINGKTIRVDWELVGSHGYVVMWSTDPTFKTGTSHKYITGHSVSNYTITVPSGADQYYVRVRAWRNWDTGKVYGAWSESAKSGDAAAKVTGLKTSARGSNGSTLTISWDAQANADSYNVYAYNKPADSWTYITTVATNKYIDETVTPGYEYNYRVVAVKDGVEGMPSDALHTCAACETMKAPTVQKNGSQIKVNWELVGSHGYVVMWSTDPTFKTGVSHKYITGHSVNNYTITGINSNQTYYVRVRAWRNWDTGYVYGAWSDNAVAK